MEERMNEPNAPGSPTPTAAPQSGAAASGLYYADVPNRIFAYIIDVIILAVVFIVAGLLLAAIVGPVATIDENFQPQFNFGAALVGAVVNAIISAVYFVYTWTSMRGTLGMKALGMQVGSAATGATLTMNQALVRWALLFGPGAVAQAFGFSGIGLLLNLAAFIWWIVLLVTTAQSPTKQGLHDRYAESVVVKAARAVG
jgi:uncharacterized RDD family membrane protein YckC